LEGVSFPDSYVDVVDEPGTTTTTTTWTWPTDTYPTFDPWSQFLSVFMGGSILVIMMIAVCASVGVVVARSAPGTAGGLMRQRYLPPAVQVEALGLCRGLSVVEAAVLHEVPLERVFAMIIFGLLRKGMITLRRAASGKPTFEPNPEAIATTASTGTLHYYERLFLRAILPGGSLDKAVIRTTLNTLIQTTARKLEGFSRTDTKTYYRQMIDRAWTQMATAATPTDQMRALDEFAEWLLIDPDLKQRLTPYTVWYTPLWYHHFHTTAIGPLSPLGITPPTTTHPPRITTGTGTTTGPGPTTPPIITTGPTTPPITTTGPTTGAPPITIVNFANTFVTATQNFANTVVTGFQQLANQIATTFRPPPPPSAFHAGPSHGSSSHGGGGHACACACACVSCACACAGGGR
jgi:hypothetical protein